jgi:hypothetical protein
MRRRVFGLRRLGCLDWEFSIYSLDINSLGIELNAPAVPHNPNPALKIVDPLLISATASSASLKSFDAPLTTAGAGSRFDFVFASCLYRVDVVENDLAAVPVYLTARGGSRGAFRRP